MRNRMDAGGGASAHDFFGSAAHGDVEGQGFLQQSMKSGSSSSLSVGVNRPPPSVDVPKRHALIIFAVGIVLHLLAGEGYKYAVAALALSAVGIVFSRYLYDWLMSKDEGTIEMKGVADPIREGSAAFLKTQVSMPEGQGGKE